MTDASLPPRPWEIVLEKTLRNAMRRAEEAGDAGEAGDIGEADDIEVRGRACYLIFHDHIERYLIPDEVIDRAVGASRGNADLLLGELTFRPWDAKAASLPVDDGMVWFGDDGRHGHWCLDPATCEQLRRRGD